MLYIVFQLGGERYALEAGRIVEVAPLMKARHMPRAPRGVTGVLNFRGRPIPVVDLCEVALNRPSAQLMSTRLLIVRYGIRLLALVAEHTNGTMHRYANDFTSTGVDLKEARFLGPVTSDEQGFIQRIELDQLFSQELREALFEAVDEMPPEANTSAA